MTDDALYWRIKFDLPVRIASRRGTDGTEAVAYVDPDPVPYEEVQENPAGFLPGTVAEHAAWRAASDALMERVKAAATLADFDAAVAAYGPVHEDLVGRALEYVRDRAAERAAHTRVAQAIAFQVDHLGGGSALPWRVGP